MTQEELDRRFYHFIQHNDIPNANLCLELGADINQVYLGCPALFRAYFNNNINTIKFLINNGANPLLENTFYDHNFIDHALIYFRKKNINLNHGQIETFLLQYKTQKTMIDFHPGCYVFLLENDILNSTLKEEYKHLLACHELNLL